MSEMHNHCDVQQTPISSGFLKQTAQKYNAPRLTAISLAMLEVNVPPNTPNVADPFLSPMHVEGYPSPDPSELYSANSQNLFYEKTVRRTQWAKQSEDRQRQRRVARLRWRSERCCFVRADSASLSLSQSQSSASLQYAVVEEEAVSTPIPFSELSSDSWRQIGSGRFGSVYSCRYANKDAAVKTLHPRATSTEISAFLNEINSLLAFRGQQNILRALGWSFSSERGYILVTELCSGGCLHQQLVAGLDENIFGGVLHCVASALSHLHLHGIVHADVSARNILLCSNGTAKLADIGLAVPIGGRPLWVAVPWAAPEALKLNAIADTSFDAWSFGVLIWEMLNVPYVEPFSWIGGDDRMLAVSHLVSQGEVLPTPRGLNRNKKSFSFWCIALQCFRIIPSERPSLLKVLDTLREVGGGAVYEGIVPEASTVVIEEDCEESCYFG